MAARGSKAAIRPPDNDGCAPRSLPAPLDSSRLRASKPRPSPKEPRRPTGSADTTPSQSPPEHKEGWPQMKSAGLGTSRDPLTAGLARFATFAKRDHLSSVPAAETESR